MSLLTVWDDGAHLETLVLDVTDPDHRRTCTTGGVVEVCMVQGYEDWEPLVRSETTTALQAVPAGAATAGPRYRPRTELAWPRKRRRTAAPRPRARHRRTGHRLPADDWAHIRGDDDPDIPGAFHGRVAPIRAAEVLTFALVAHADPALKAALETELQASPYGWHDMGGGGVFDDALLLRGGANTLTPEARTYAITSSVGPWSRGAATLGLELANDTVPAELHADWVRWVDPATDANALIETFELNPLLPPTELAEQAGLDLGPFDPRCT